MQAIISYMDNLKLLMIMCLAAISLVFLLRKAAQPAVVDHSVVME